MITQETTTYSIIDEHDERSSITLSKREADALQQIIDVHQWVQVEYLRLCDSHPKLGRRKKGDAIRRLAYVVARKNQNYRPLADEL
jgi:cation transport regulator ChaC